jgi:16S rRNA (cytosine1402-N4)-methyltransferase
MTLVLSPRTDPFNMSEAADVHLPVLVEEVCAAFDFGRPALIVDGTLGLGGHSEALLKRHSTLRIIGIEWDEQALEMARERLAPFGDRVRTLLGSYADVQELLARAGVPQVDGLLVDLGLSSFQLSDAARGFSFQRPGRLDMRMSGTLSRTAWDILTQSSVDELTALFRAFGEDPRARRIAAVLKDAQAAGSLRNDAWAVAELIRQTAGGHRGGIDPATRVFQAFRIAVNGELDNLHRLLGALSSILRSGGRAGIIAFHSLEDSRVKSAFHQAARGCVCPPQIPQCVCGKVPWATLRPRKAIQASPQEVASNARARSARLRILEKL